MILFMTVLTRIRRIMNGQVSFFVLIIFSSVSVPRSGLDSQSTSQFVSLMVNLTHKQKRTLVCTLHQPSALMFEKFDQVYALTAGRCIYQGPPNLVIPYFAERAIVCPPYHNPADFRKYYKPKALGVYSVAMVSVWTFDKFL